MARGGVLYRSKGGLSQFDLGHNPFPGGDRRTGNSNEAGLRHVALHHAAYSLWVYYSNSGDAPERILRSRILLGKDWATWRASAPEEVLRPENPEEGMDLPIKPSAAGAMKEREHALRDPAVFVDADGKVYLLYSVAGEAGIGIAELLPWEVASLICRAFNSEAGCPESVVLRLSSFLDYAFFWNHAGSM